MPRRRPRLDSGRIPPGRVRPPGSARDEMQGAELWRFCATGSLGAAVSRVSKSARARPGNVRGSARGVGRRGGSGPARTRFGGDAGVKGRRGLLSDLGRGGKGKGCGLGGE